MGPLRATFEGAGALIPVGVGGVCTKLRVCISAGESNLLPNPKGVRRGAWPASLGADVREETPFVDQTGRAETRI